MRIRSTFQCPVSGWTFECTWQLLQRMIYDIRKTQVPPQVKVLESLGSVSFSTTDTSPQYACHLYNSNIFIKLTKYCCSRRKEWDASWKLGMQFLETSAGSQCHWRLLVWCHRSVADTGIAAEEEACREKDVPAVAGKNNLVGGAFTDTRAWILFVSEDWMLDNANKMLAECQALLNGGVVVGVWFCNRVLGAMFPLLCGFPGNKGIEKICRWGFDIYTFPQSKNFFMRGSNWSCNVVLNQDFEKSGHWP